MRVLIEADAAGVSRRAAQFVAQLVRSKPDCVLGLATGSTPQGLYAELVRMHQDEGLDFARVTSFNLDEYVGLGPDHPQSYRQFMDEQFFRHVNIPTGRTHLPDGLAEDPDKACRIYEAHIVEAGGIDLQILGIGRDGHIAFNEPGSSLGCRTHLAVLAPETIRDNARFFAREEEVPTLAVTMGIGTILDSRQCLLLATGAHKAEAIAAALEGPLTVRMPASALQLHPDPIFILDEAAARGLQHRETYRTHERILAEHARRNRK